MTNRSVRVCHFSSKHSLGDARVFWKECRSLAAAGYEVIYVGIGESDECEGVRRVGLDAPMSRSDRLFAVRQRAYEAARDMDADIYHFHDPDLLPFGRRLKRAGKKVIFDSHELFVEQFQVRDYIPKIARRALAGIYGWYERGVCAELDAVIFPTTVHGQHPFSACAQRAVTVDNLSLLPEKEIDPSDSSADKVCYIGSLTPDRGVDVLVEACHKVGVGLILCGRISSSYLVSLRQRKAFETVDFRGEIPYGEIGAVMGECFAGAATLLRQGQWNSVDNLPTKVYDYMLHYLPVLVNDAPRTSQFVDRWQCGLAVDTASSDAVARAVEWLASHSSEARAMGARGHEVVMHHVNWKSEERKLLELYDSLCS